MLLLPRHCTRNLLIGFGWGACLVLMPFDMLVFAAPALIPLLIWWETRRGRPICPWQSKLVRYGTTSLVVVAALLAPVKAVDRRVGPFPKNTITLGELKQQRLVFLPYEPHYEAVVVSLPSARPTRQEIEDAIRTQTGLRTSTYRCAHTATLLFGSQPSPISVLPAKQESALGAQGASNALPARPQPR